MRVFDFFAALFGLIVLSPLFFLICLLSKLSSPGPVFYRGPRVGKDGKLFRVLKFRSMVTDADNLGPPITAKGDSRITFIGRILRRTKVDELPQLINVLKGEMSLVGPRPEYPCYVAQYTPDQKQMLNFRPGITSAASLAYRGEEQMLAGPDWETVYRTQVLPAKLAIDLDYLSRRTFLSDILLILRTIASMFR
jgi:lipopolysaccharide/colanic/teichoic acid biosynthesis glycosyltransferase